jgi:DNA polymerase (family 10)/putative hydrolase
MKVWKRYRKFLLAGEWHIHTHYTDGRNSVSEYCRSASELGIPLVAFTEHVRKKLDYNFDAFIEDIERARDEFDLIILSGCEAKVLPDGNLDVSEEILTMVDYPVFSYHSFPPDSDLYLQSLRNVLNNKYVNAWAHPNALMDIRGMHISDENLKGVFQCMKENDILLERNQKYGVPDPAWMAMANSYEICLVRGSDCHGIEEMRENSLLMGRSSSP